MGVRIGAAIVFHVFDIAFTLSFEIGAMLRIWGPPFAGEAYVDLGIVAFTVPIGDRSASRELKSLDWDEFKAHFLPEQPLRITIISGLVEERKDEGYIIVNPSELRLAVESYVPIPDGVQGREKPAAGPPLGIRPMSQKTLVSSMTLEWGQTPGRAPELAYRDIRKSLPEALWSPDPTPDARTATELEAKAIPNVLMGIEMLPKECQQIPPSAVEHQIKINEENVPTRSWEKKRNVHEPFYEKNRRFSPDSADRDLAQTPKPVDVLGMYRAPNRADMDLFRKNLRPPEPIVIEAMRSAGFSNILTDTVDLKLVFDALDPTGLWLAAPTFVQIGKLPPLPHG